jgi:hypothetical protein
MTTVKTHLLADFVQGLNLPWVGYGIDFGANAWQAEGGLSRSENRDRLARSLDRAAALQPGLLRWFLLCDGRAGIRYDARGDARGPDESLFRDMDAAVAGARERGLRLLFVLFDFLWLAPRRRWAGVQLGGRRGLVARRSRRDRLLANVVAPILDRYGAEPAIAAWDVINEPEWATLGWGAWDPRRAVAPRAMRALIREVAELVHERSSQPATVGLASAAGLGLVRGLALDFYQVHWYDSLEARAPLHTPVSVWGADRPVLLGEYPTRGSALQPPEIVSAARRAGYGGALAWSLLADDAASDADACARALAGADARERGGA